MRRKSVGKRKAPTSATVTAPSLSAIPLLSTSPEPGPEPRTEPVDLLDKSICICCDNKGQGEEGLLVCTQSGCPVTVHAACIGSKPKFDDCDNFYCPYCWYKRAVDTCQQLREKALAAQKALSRFLDNDARADSAAARADSAAARASPVQDAETESQENKDEDERKVPVSISCSSVSESNGPESKVVSVKERKGAPAKRLLFQQVHQHEHYNAKGKINEEEVTSFQTLRQLQRSPGKMIKWTSLTGKRKRLLWTDEEEKVLKEGVLKFSTENQNIPWKKILEFGCRVFDETRTPVDLKDKWKNIISKEGCK